MPSPYANPVTTISDISPYFHKDPTTATMTFIGESLELRIPKSFERHDYLTVSDGQVTTLGIFDMIFDGQYRAGFNLLASISISPTDMGKMTYNGIEYLTLFLTKGDVFMANYVVLQDKHVVYVLWSEFVTAGRPPYMLDYPALLGLFNHVVELTGSGIGVSRSVYEGIIAHISRDRDNIAVPYRLTAMRKPYRLVALKDVSAAPSSTIARLNGAYFTSDGLTSALRHQVDEQQPFENILRGVESVAIQRDDPSGIADWTAVTQ